MYRTKYLILCLLSISITGGLSFAQQEPNRPVSIGSRGRRVVYNTKGIKPVAHEEILDILEQEEKQNTNELINKFRQFPREQKLETVIYCLKENKYVDLIVPKIAIESQLHDKCFVPYLVEIIPKLKGRTMMMAARAAQMIPDVNFMEPLLNYAVESDYQESYIGGTGRYAAEIHSSSFVEAASAISVITNFRMGGIDQVSEKSKEEMIQQWRSAWPQVKKEMQDEIEAKQKEIRPVAHRELIALLAEAENAKDKSEFNDIYDSYKLNDRLETIAYTLEQGLYLNSLGHMVYHDKELQQDKRIVPFIAKAIKESKGEKLLTAVQLTMEIPDPDLLPFLIKYAFDTDYTKIYRYGQDDNLAIYSSIFGSASYTISDITGGKIGTKKYRSTNKEIPEEGKKSQIEKWRKIYDETLKQDYEPSKLILPSTPVEPNKSVNKTPDDKIVP